MTRARFPLRSKIALFAAGQLVLAVLGLSYFTVVEPWQQKIAAQANAARTLVDTVAPSIVQLSAAGPRWNADGVRALFETRRWGRLGEAGHSVNAVYAIIFAEPFPARATVQVSALPRGAQVEIDAVAIIDS